jgi:steroid 5-alpha reductase family enzyme
MVLLGFFIHVRSDAILRKLRTDGGGEYGIPQGFLYRYLSCPNYLGEIVQWLGWAVLCWNLAGLSFAVWTIANLAPRAAAHHRWYRERFSGYPAERKALVPGLF